MKRTLHLFLLCCLLPLGVFGQPGSFDPDFGTNGRVAANIGAGISDMVLQPDGKIVASGGYGVNVDTSFMIVRYLEDGTLDAEFGDNGRVITQIGDSAAINSIALQPDGKIVAAGSSSIIINGVTTIDVAVARYNTDGSLDTTFNTTGFLTIPLEGTSNANVVKIQQDGKILLAGIRDSQFSIIRLFEDGTIDESFNMNGYPHANTNRRKEITAMELLPDGSILASGRINNTMNVVKYTSTGLPDESFGNAGWVSLAHISGITYMPGIVVLENGDIIIAGGIMPSTKYIGILVKLSANGSLVESFGENGILYNDVGANLSCQAREVAVSRGKLIVGYSSGLTSNYDFNVSAYDMNGVPDITFADNGSNIFTFGGLGHEYLCAIVIQPDDKILVGGTGPVMMGFRMARLMPVDAVADTESFDKTVNRFMVYPNPVTANSVLMLDIKNSGPVTLQLYDVKGTLISTIAQSKFFAAGKTEVPLQLPQLEKGVYFLNIREADKQSNVVKIVN
ncbi:T9SS type A sorting domain-containing protein [Flavobacterium sp. Sd200]|uniref:T9SS type A sorting domain-containing protein n=1 Tax=Flavobacterium sp. Sd200 TaxID=2692211 RepID=UPI00136992BB|nr:T9SS type A sorting domain-containing protein [Flavobacterium sp. Sd200]MXN92207.1 T9SS type A sorting domain-containing protein [Flavobacterium sp. Sd200]